mmetsp:Transcript_46696/g.155767  ORF Transcript_46696/g.155767 Transcript_46696/m.155767 type:complete len:200 (+) Transcript_46696:572-1171(+)
MAAWPVSSVVGAVRWDGSKQRRNLRESHSSSSSLCTSTFARAERTVARGPAARNSAMVSGRKVKSMTKESPPPSTSDSSIHVTAAASRPAYESYARPFIGTISSPEARSKLFVVLCRNASTYSRADDRESRPCSRSPSRPAGSLYPAAGWKASGAALEPAAAAAATAAARMPSVPPSPQRASLRKAQVQARRATSLVGT